MFQEFSNAGNISGDTHLDLNTFTNFSTNVSVKLNSFPAGGLSISLDVDAHIALDLVGEKVKLLAKTNKLSFIPDPFFAGQRNLNSDRFTMILSTLKANAYSEMILDARAGEISIRMGDTLDLGTNGSSDSTVCIHAKIPPSMLRLNGSVVKDALNRAKIVTKIQTALNELPHDTSDGISSYKMSSAYNQRFAYDWAVRSNGVPETFGFEGSYGFPETFYAHFVGVNFSNWQQGTNTFSSKSCLSTNSTDLSTFPPLLAVQAFMEEFVATPEDPELATRFEDQILTLFETLNTAQQEHSTWTMFAAVSIAAVGIVGAAVAFAGWHFRRRTQSSELLLSG